MEDTKKLSQNNGLSVDYKINGECPEKCGRCCSSILPMSEYEIKKIKKYMKRNPEKFGDPINPNDNLNEKNYKDVCPFIDENGRCKIYVHRPEMCKKFICGKHTMDFNYGDKALYNMWDIFYPEILVLNKPDIIEMNKYFSQMKEKAKIK